MGFYEEGKGELARELYFWVEDGKPHARIGTNAPKAVICRRLESICCADGLEDVDVFEDALGLNGGNYAIARWRDDVAVALLRERLPGL